MDTNLNESPIQTAPQEDVPPKTGPSVIFSIIAVIAFIFLIIAVNATAIYFGSKKNQASEPISNLLENVGEEEVIEEEVPADTENGEAQPELNPDGTLINTDGQEEAPAEETPAEEAPLEETPPQE